MIASSQFLGLTVLRSKGAAAMSGQLQLVNMGEDWKIVSVRMRVNTTATVGARAFAIATQTESKSAAAESQNLITAPATRPASTWTRLAGYPGAADRTVTTEVIGGLTVTSYDVPFTPFWLPSGVTTADSPSQAASIYPIDMNNIDGNDSCDYVFVVERWTYPGYIDGVQSVRVVGQVQVAP